MDVDGTQPTVSEGVRKLGCTTVTQKIVHMLHLPTPNSLFLREDAKVFPCLIWSMTICWKCFSGARPPSLLRCRSCFVMTREFNILPLMETKVESSLIASIVRLMRIYVPSYTCVCVHVLQRTFRQACALPFLLHLSFAHDISVAKGTKVLDRTVQSMHHSRHCTACSAS